MTLNRIHRKFPRLLNTKGNQF